MDFAINNPKKTMKTYPLFFSMLIFLTSSGWSQSANDYYQRGVLAMERGDVAQAETSFRQALQVNANHAHARYQLGQLKIRAGQLKATRREQAFASITLDQVNFDEAPLRDALRALGQMVEASRETDAEGEDGKEAKDSGSDKKADADSLVVNFVVQDPKGTLSEREVSLQLKNVSAKSVLDYLLQQVQATARFDEHAIVIRPTG